MLTRHTWVGLGLALLLTGVAAAADKADPREKPETALADLVRIVEANEVGAYFEKYAPPEEIKRITQDGKRTVADGIAEIKKRLDKHPEESKEFAGMLKKALEAKPQLSADGNEATFKAPNPAPADEVVVIFKKDGKFWKIKDIRASGSSPKKKTAPPKEPTEK